MNANLPTVEVVDVIPVQHPLRGGQLHADVKLWLDPTTTLSAGANPRFVPPIGRTLRLVDVERFVTRAGKNALRITWADDQYSIFTIHVKGHTATELYERLESLA